VQYIVYVSQAARPMSGAELEAVLDRSRTNNDRDGITGLLIYRYSPDTGSGHFIQMLEGEEDVLSATFGRIAADRRHHSVVVLDRGAIDRRMFRDWAMGFRNVDDALFARLPGYARLGDDSFDAARIKASHRGALEMLKFFYES
jgi:hypothetical protein